jgi:hypothetical protein
VTFRTRRTLYGLALAGVAVVLGAVTGSAQQNEPFEQPPINYSRAKSRDAVAGLLQRIARREIVLAGPDREILRGVLQALQIPVESQVVVFSRTSLQAGLIRPEHPRALYFSDSVYVGWVPEGLVEVAAIDPELGPVFYSFDPQDAREATRTFVRESSCLRCHGGTFVREIPGLLARSVFPSERGDPLLRHGTDLVDDETPFEKRWGGWYVTGYQGKDAHRGNTFAAEKDNQLVFNPSEARPAELSQYFDTARYLAPTSDVVALLVFEHQLAMHNSLTKAGQSGRRMMDYQHALQKSLGEPFTDEPAYDSVKSVFAGAVEDVLDHLLFRNAAPLPAGTAGGDAFRRAFATGARKNAAGASLKDLSLQGRLLANRCSYLIYSASFEALPAPLKRRVLERLSAVLKGEDASGRYAYLEKTEKRRILEILRETYPGSDATKYFERTAR